jgi:hypothetical protein
VAAREVRDDRGVRAAALLAGLALLGNGYPDRGPAGQARPALAEGKTVTLCGRLDGSLLREDDPAPSWHAVDIVAYGPMKPTTKWPVCLTGKLVYLGCRTGGNTCIDYSQDYGIRIRSYMRR